ncbi:GntR family transcriptional regulator [Pseudalkalibacillus salsuginis]|uniref:GntR family transcriptional regulator n=1 Tax=Pseudalkalibacillus salsuginis TaxID=2910972 RepID=UPI001F27ABE4|nr:GntR family transcriptional regulator [Pseudalkalibacillus salsuginis]MCF6411597.1 GntR family transcriptional regulator [Pseudalkalibacillus salsuginis]
MKTEKDIKTDKVFRYVFDSIKNGEFTTGQMLTESGIVKKLGVSRTPVREALRRLEKYGLVESEPHKGVKVISITKERITDLYQVREVLEGLGAKLIAMNRNHEQVGKLHAILSQAKKAVEDDDIETLSSINSSFHLEIAKASHNTYLVNIFETLQSHIQLVMLTSLSNKDRPKENLKEHKMIVEAIESWDPELAEAIIKGHVRRAYRAALKKLNLDE